MRVLEIGQIYASGLKTVLVKLTSLRTCKYTLLTSYFSWTTSNEVTDFSSHLHGVGWAINILSTLLTASRRSKTTTVQKLRFRNYYFHRFRNHHDSEPIAIQQLSLQHAETTTIHKLYHKSDTISRFRNHDTETSAIQKPRCRNYQESETSAIQKLSRFRNYDSETTAIQKLSSFRNWG